MTLAMVVAAAGLLCGSVAAETAAASADSESTSAQFARVGKVTTEFRFTFDRRESLRAGTRVRDVSGHRHHGLISTSNGGHLRKVNGHPGKAAKFPCIGCGRALISVRDARHLDPGRKPFWFGASIKVTDAEARAGRDPNIMQKGLINQPGGRWKLELIGSRPVHRHRCCRAGRCPSRSAHRQLRLAHVAVPTPKRCRQLVDRRCPGVRPKGRAHRSLSPTTPRCGFGAKALRSGGGNDQYHGRLDSLFYKIDRR